MADVQKAFGVPVPLDSMVAAVALGDVSFTMMFSVIWLSSPRWSQRLVKWIWRVTPLPPEFVENYTSGWTLQESA